MISLALAVPLLLVPQSAVDVTVPRIDTPMQIDGSIDEPAWAGATVLEDFVTRNPIEGRAPSQVTRVRMLRDDQRLYVAFEALDTEPKLIRSTLADRDAIFEDDFVAIVLDPFQDGRRGFILFANPSGVQADCVYVEGAFSDDCNWDLVYSSAGRIGEQGYTVEIAVPFAHLRFDPDRDAWGFGVTRVIARIGEQVTIPEVQQARGSPTRQLGTMRGMKGIPVTASVAVIPEITVGGGPAARDGRHVAEEGRPGKDSALAGDVGVTVKIARANTAVDAALNPDFSQVESDAARISFNERFALFFQEKRPFFLEGRELFSTPWEAVYTRSIVDPLYGVKVTGKSGPTAFAILHALDESPAPSTLDPRWAADSYGDKSALTTIARVQTAANDTLTLGALATDKHVGNAWNRVAGLDAGFNPAPSLRFAMHTLLSATDHPDGTYESGDAFKLRFFRNGRAFNWFSWYEQLSPGFRAEAGFIQRAGYREAGAVPSLKLETGRQTGLLAVKLQSTMNVLNETETDGRERGISTEVDFVFPAIYVDTAVVHQHQHFRGETFEARQGVLAAAANPRKWVSLSASIEGGEAIAYFADEPYLGGSFETAAGLGLRPAERFSLGISATRTVFSEDGPGDAFRQTAGREGEATVFDETVGRLSSQLFFTQVLSLRVIADWDGTSDTVAPSVLLSWRPGPGSVVYAGYQDAFATEGNERREGRAGFLKISYLFGTTS